MFCDGPGQLAAIQVTAALGIADAMIEWRRFDLEAELCGVVLSTQKDRIVCSTKTWPGNRSRPNVIRSYLNVYRDRLDSQAFSHVRY
jgi:hypothetical protein